MESNKKDIELIFQNNCDESTILADESSVIMSISNLIGNAIKFSSRGSIHLILHKDSDDSIILDVVDTGIGIGVEYLDKIFEPYLQERMGYGRMYDGVGLGLALVKKVLDLSGAKISVKSIKGEGTTFSVNFGKAVKIDEKTMEVTTHSKISPVSEKLHKPLILIVEDDSINQMTIKRFLDKSYDSIVSKSSGAAIDLLRNNKIDLILMDISILGEKNGLELTKDLKSSKEYSHIPVIAITGAAFEVDRQNAIESGCDNFLAKPFSKLELLDMINLYLPESS
jgi:CheY-like chemotaxis protein